MTNEHEQRREWFDTYFARTYDTRFGDGLVDPVEDKFWFFCPCCGYPTLMERGGYEICCLCNWEDDGQDDPHADEIWGGPNGGYSLTEARENFQRYWVMYHPDNDTRIAPGDSDRTLQAKKTMVGAFEKIKNADDAEQKDLWEIINQCNQTLDDELSRKLREYQQQQKSA